MDSTTVTSVSTDESTDVQDSESTDMQLADAQTTSAENDAAPAPRPYPAIGKAWNAFVASIRREVERTDSADVVELRTALAALPDLAVLASARAALTVEIESKSGAAKNETLLMIGQTYADGVAALLSTLRPTPVQTSSTGSTGNGRMKSAQTVARTIADVEADPSIRYIGAPLAEIDALGHDCRVVKILRNGSPRKANTAQQVTMLEESEDAAQHDACCKLARSTYPIFKRRADLRSDA